jgi:hypothetical protein
MFLYQAQGSQVLWPCFELFIVPLALTFSPCQDLLLIEHIDSSVMELKIFFPSLNKGK